MIDKEDLSHAVLIGQKNKKNPSIGQMNKFINKVLESVYSRAYLGTHTLSGKESWVTKKTTAASVAVATATGKEIPPAKKPKPGLPDSDVTAILGNYHYLKSIFVKKKNINELYFTNYYAWI